MRLNVLKKCSKSRICSDEHFLIQQKGFFDRSKYKHSLQSGYVSQNTLYVWGKFGYGPNLPRRKWPN